MIHILTKHKKHKLKFKHYHKITNTNAKNTITNINQLKRVIKNFSFFSFHYFQKNKVTCSSCSSGKNMKVAQKIKHAKIHMQKFIQNPFPPLNPPTNQTHKPRKIINSTWKKQTQKFKVNTAATWNHQTQSNLICPSFHSHPLLFFLSRPFP